MEENLENNASKELIEEDLMFAYLGDGANKLAKDKLNFGAAILGQTLGPVWFFYRRAHLLGFIYILISFVVGYISSLINYDQAYYIMFFIYLFTATPALLWDARRKSKKILANVGMTDYEKIELAKKKGRPSWLAVVIYILGLLLYIFALGFLMIMALALESGTTNI